LTQIQSNAKSVYNDNLSFKNNKFKNLYNISRCLNSKHNVPQNHACKSEIYSKINKEKKKDLNKYKGKIKYLFRRKKPFLYHSKFNNINNSLIRNNESEYSIKNNANIGI
jgi:hypothetical protein